MASQHGRGIHTVEGTVAGQRASGLARQREDEQKAFEERRQALKAEGRRGLEHIGERFRTAAKQTHIARSTVGLMTLEQFRSAMRAENEPAPEKEDDADEKAAQRQREKETRLRKRKLEQKKLSFGEEDEEEDETSSRVQKCPHVDTEFLPDAERDAAKRAETERQKKEELERQARERTERFDVAFTYNEDSSRRRVVSVLKGGTVGEIVAAARARVLADADGDLNGDLSATPAETLHFVRGDLILPHHLCVYDLALGKVHGKRQKGAKKSAPLFDFSQESHDATLVTRNWYDANKHIFPVNRWIFYTAMNSNLPAPS